MFLVEPLQMPHVLCMQLLHILLSWVWNLLRSNWCPHHQCDRLSVLVKLLLNSKMITPVGDDSKTVLEDASTQEDNWSKPCYRGEKVLDPPQEGALLALQLRKSMLISLLFNSWLPCHRWQLPQRRRWGPMRRRTSVPASQTPSSSSGSTSPGNMTWPNAEPPFPFGNLDKYSLHFGKIHFAVLK